MPGDEGDDPEPPIAVMSFDRPQYFAPVLASLRAQVTPIDDARVHLFQDGAVSCYSGLRHGEDADIEACVALFREAFPGGTVHRSPWNLGIAESFRRAERFVFEELDAPVAFFFEDDLELSPHYVDALATIWDVVRHEPRIGYFNAMGPHTATLAEQAQRSRALVRMHHNWGFGLTRNHWHRIAERLDQYYDMVVGRDYALRSIEDLQALFRSWGVPLAPTSQDAAKHAATLAAGCWRASSGPCLGRYIGEHGTHSKPQWYAEGRWAETKLWLDPLPRPELPTPDEIDQAVAEAIEEEIEAERRRSAQV